MSYPDKDKKMEKQPEKLQSPQKKRKKKALNSLQEMNKEQDSRLPVGKLKWSKEDEAYQDTKINLDLDDKEMNQSDSEAKDQNLEQPVVSSKSDDGKEQDAPAIFNDSSDLREDVSPLETPSQDHKAEDLKISEEQNSGLGSTQTSLEDTLTPIDFKEYSIEPGFKPSERRFDSYDSEPIFSDYEEQAEESEEMDVPEKGRSVGKKISTWTLIILSIPLLLIVVLIAGLIIGHSVIGEQPAGDVFDIKMWEHIYNLIFG